MTLLMPEELEELHRTFSIAADRRERLGEHSPEMAIHATLMRECADKIMVEIRKAWPPPTRRPPAPVEGETP
jgi:hypothetical protein